jgi:hypothetical protein
MLKLLHTIQDGCLPHGMLASYSVLQTLAKRVDLCRGALDRQHLRTECTSRACLQQIVSHDGRVQAPGSQDRRADIAHLIFVLLLQSRPFDMESFLHLLNEVLHMSLVIGLQLLHLTKQVLFLLPAPCNAALMVFDDLLCSCRDEMGSISGLEPVP